MFLLTDYDFPDVFPHEFVGGLVDDGDGDASLDALMEKEDPATRQVLAVVYIRRQVPGVEQRCLVLHS